MIKINSTIYASTITGSVRLIVAHPENLLNNLEESVNIVTSNMDKIDVNRTSPEEAKRFISFIRGEVEKLKYPYANALENVESMEFSIRDLTQKVEDFISYNLQIGSTGISDII